MKDAGYMGLSPHGAREQQSRNSRQIMNQKDAHYKGGEDDGDDYLMNTKDNISGPSGSDRLSGQE